MLLTDLLTDRHQKFLSGAQLDTLRKIPCKFQLIPSSRLGGVVRTRFFDFDDLQTYLRTNGKNACTLSFISGQYKNCKYFLDLANHKTDHGVDAEHNFFSSSHGKV